MPAKPEYRDRDDTEVAVLDALVDRTEEGMTVFELRAGVDGADIDDLEAALSDLKDDGLITVANDKEPMRIYPDDRVVPAGDPDENGEPSLLERLRERLGM